jgi:hypothetical protein
VEKKSSFKTNKSDINDLTKGLVFEVGGFCIGEMGVIERP